MVTGTDLLARLQALITDTPDFVDSGWRRLVAMGRGALPTGAAVHGVWACLFWFVDQPALALFNVGSATLWLWACWGFFSTSMLTTRRIRLVIFLCAMIEVPAHAVFATIITGLDTGFHLYLLSGLTMIPVAHFLKPSTRVWIACLIIALYIAIVAYARIAGPAAPMSETVAFWIAVTNAAAAATVIFILGLMLSTATKHAETRLTDERERADRLLLNILPKEIAERLKTSPEIIAEDYDDATILFADIVGFTEASANMSPSALVKRLDLVFTAFDGLTEARGVEKIKTIGDAYMAVAGLPTPRADHAQVMADLARDMLAEVDRINETIEGDPVRIRIGLNSGPVVAGVIGRSKFAYDLWGDAVNVAARMEQLGVAGEARMTQATRDRLKAAADCRDLGEMEVRGKGMMRVFALTPAPAAPG